MIGPLPEPVQPDPQPIAALLAILTGTLIGIAVAATFGLI